MNTLKKINNFIPNKNELDLDRIIDTFTPYVRKIINNMAGDKLSYEDKEEILADTFFILWKNRNTDILLLDSYIAGIVKNLTREKLKKEKITYNILDFEKIVGTDNINTFIEDRIEIERCLKILKKDDLKIFNMYYYSSKSIKDIAKELEISEINVYTKLSRIRKKLRKELDKGGHYGKQ